MTQQFAGARWWKFDFHTHTPFSQDTPWHKLIGEPGELTPEAWLQRFMDAGIDCVAVTDHNGAGWIDRLKDAYAGMRASGAEGFRELHLFPGVEISANGGIHILAIFDPQAAGADIDALLGEVRFRGTRGDSNACTEASIKDVLDAIWNAGGIAIPAHVDRDKGLLRLKDDAARGSGFDALSLEQALQSGRVYAAERCDLQSPLPARYEESGCRWTWVLGTDCHSFRGEASRPGARFTWVKMGQPTLQGLRLALLDGRPLSVIRSDDPEAATDPNDHAKAFIESIEIENARHAGGRGKPLVADFSPWLSALIGGRGSGKSTVLEALRWALRRDQEIPPELEELKQFGKVSKNSEPGGVLGDTELRVLFRKDRMRYRIRWRADGQGNPIEELDQSGNWIPSPGEVAGRFPVRIYSQKQIFALARDPRALLGMIDESPAVNGVQWRADLEAAERAFLRLRAESREQQGKLGEKARLEGELADVVRQLQVFEEGGHKELLQRYQRVRRQRRALDARAQELQDAGRRLREVAEALVPTDVPAADFEAANAVERSGLALLQQAADHQQQLSDSLRELASRHEAFARDWGSIVASDWAAHEAQVTADYGALEVRLAEEGVKDPAAYGELVQRRQRIEKALADLDRVQGRILELDGLADAKLRDIEALRRELRARRTEFLAGVLAGNEFVRIAVRACGSQGKGAEAEFRKLLNKEAPTFQDDILSDDGEGLLGTLYSDLESGGDEEVLRRLRQLKDDLTDARGGGERLPTSKRFRKCIVEMRADAFDHLLLWWPEDDLDIQYRREAGKDDFRSIEQGSPGQKSAAILAFILSHGTEPVILDQPEDDLDTHLIYSLIVRQIRTMKVERQVIVATHNPNIVVNGDAEMILAMEYDNGQCRVCAKSSGSLQNRDVRKEICDVMEGGKTAFEERYRRVIEEVGRV